MRRPVMLFALLLLLSGMLSSCTDSPPKAIDRSVLKPDDIAIYVKNRKINLYKSSIKDINSAMGASGAVVESYRDEYGTREHSDFLGSFSVDYYKETGKLSGVTIYGEGATIGRKVGVGSSREEVVTYLVNGIREPRKTSCF